MHMVHIQEWCLYLGEIAKNIEVDEGQHVLDTYTVEWFGRDQSAKKEDGSKRTVKETVTTKTDTEALVPELK